jgi:transaldolase
MYIEDLKFSLWGDFIERDYLDHEFKELINKKIVNGATSNPAIFKNAILSSPAYIEQIESLGDNLTAKEKYEAVAIFDIQKAADILKPLHDAGDHGYVSIEVDPFLCDDAKATIEEGKRLFSQIQRENVMIKVPATEAGYEAMEALVGVGIPVNATLVFKKSQAVSSAEAFARGIAKYGTKVDTVISIFVSRIDRALDPLLKTHDIETSLSGIYNTSEIYEEIESKQVLGCQALFASTGVKDDSLPAYYYVEKLLAYNTINTAPIETIKAFHEHGKKEKALPIPREKVKAHFQKIADAGIDFDTLLDRQIEDGLKAFKDAFEEILGAL